MTTPHKEITSGLKFPEGPVAMPDGSVILVEIARQTLTRVMPDGKQHVIAKLGGGSIAFGVSAVASYVIVDSGLLRNAERANLGTFVGALCFLVGAFLLLPERTHEHQPAV